MSLVHPVVQTPLTAKVVIIGAGAAGLAAAIRLKEKGFRNVTILEAENRVGGRIHMVDFADGVLDMGAQWCHGEKGNAVYEMLERLGRLDLLGHTDKSEYNIMCIRSNKDLLSEDATSYMLKIAETITNKNDELKSYEGSLGAYMLEAFWKEVDKLPDKVDHTLAKEFFEIFKKGQLSLDAADTVFETAPSNTVQFWDCEGDRNLNWKDRSYQMFLNILLETEDLRKDLGLLNKNVLLNKRVRRIEWQHKGGIKITLNNGQIIEADHVIWTPSLGVLKENHKTLFTPALPLSKVRAIEGLKLGVVNKFFLDFGKPFFGDKNITGVTFLWRDEDLKLLRETKRFWLEGLLGFFYVSSKPRLLQGWILGSYARYVETLSDREVLEGLLWVLRKFLSDPVPDPINFIRTHWYTNPNFRGTYSFRSLYTDELRTGAWDLAAPLTAIDGAPIVQFAGEATHNHYFGTVHGAVETGWREADRLINYYKPKSESSIE